MNKISARGVTLFLLALLVAGLLVIFSGSSALAQCSMCRASLAGSNNAYFIKNFNIGVLVLLIPPVAMFCSIFVILRRHKLRDEEVNEPDVRSPRPEENQP